ncbi:MAG: putative peptidoglycan glycosyltransferase FtsW [Pseudobdellovibrionaceae bacterium]
MAATLNRFFSRTDTSIIARWWWTVDKGMLLAILVLMTLGITLVASASPAVATRIEAGHSHFIIRHIIFVIPSLVVMLGVSLLDHRWIRRLGSIVFAAAIFLMVLVPFVGSEIKGAHRWISFGFFALQPSEFVKPGFAIMSAWMMTQFQQQSTFRGYIIAACLYILTAFLLLLQPDFGMTFVLTFMFGVQVVVAGLPFRYIIPLALMLIVGALTIYSTFDHVKTRVDKFLAPEGTADTYQVDRSLEAFAEGGIFGKGAGQGTVKNTIPDAHADFIFSVAGEELGLIASFGIIGLYAYILFVGFNRLMDSNDMFVILASIGILAMFGLQAFIHIGSCLSILPTKGMTLPFISYGGSSILAMGFSMGVVLGLTRREVKTLISRGRKFFWNRKKA